MADPIPDLGWVALGSLIGGPARYAVSGWIGRWLGERLPWGTIVVNISGAVLIGLLAAVARGLPAPNGAAWPFLVTGVLGSYTTVSSFSLQTLSLMREGALLRAGANIALSLGLCLCAVAGGYYAGVAWRGATP